MASAEETKRRDWLTQWPYLVRVHDPQFIDGTLGNGVALSVLMDELGPVCFESTKCRVRAGEQNVDPRRSVRQKADVELSDEGFAWMTQRFESALAKHGAIPSEPASATALTVPSRSSGCADLAQRDVAEAQAGSEDAREAKAILRVARFPRGAGPVKSSTRCPCDNERRVCVGGRGRGSSTPQAVMTAAWLVSMGSGSAVSAAACPA